MSYPKSRALASLFVLLSIASMPSWGKKESGKVVDSGSFGIYVNGNRVATEKFDIVQSPELSVAKAELKLENSKSVQTAELQLLPNGNLQRYEWREKGQGSAVVEPKDEFLVEHVTLENPQKSAEQPYILPPSTMILDDYFFSQREILLWRYLATQCEMKPGEKGCPLKPAQFGVIVPRQQRSAQVSITYAGQQTVDIKGKDLQLNRFELESEGNKWVIWMDESYKIQKIAIDEDHTEVYRE